MKTNSLLIAICLAALVCCPLAGSAAEKKSASPKASASPAASVSPAAAKAARPIPFHGMVSAVDHKANTFTIAGKEKSRVFKVTDKTAVTKGANSATIKEISEKQEVSGSYWKNADGSLEAKTVKIGPMSTAKAEKSKTSASPAASPSASPKKP